MFDIGWSEMALIAVVALVAIGPKELPGVLRTAGVWARKARDLAGEFQKGLDDIAREADLKDMKDQVQKISGGGIRSQIEDMIDPTGTVKQSLEMPTASEFLKPTDKPEDKPAEIAPAAPAAPAAAPEKTPTHG